MSEVETIPTADRRPARVTPLAVNVARLVTTQLIVNAALFLTNVAIIRFYGADAHGGVLLVMAVMNVFLALSDLGLASKAGVRAIGRLRSGDKRQLERTFAGLATVQLIAAAILAATMVALAEPIARLVGGVDTTAIRLGGLWLFASATISVCAMTFLGLESMSSILLVVPVAEIAKLLWVAVCAVSGLGIHAIYLGWTAAYLGAMGVAVHRIYRLFRGLDLRLRVGGVTIRQARQIVAQGAAFYVPFLGLFSLSFVGQLITGLRHAHHEQVSIFQVSFTLALVSRLVAAPVSQAIFARAVQWCSRGSMDQASGVLDQASRLLGLVATGLFALFAAVGPWLLVAIYGPSYAQAIAVLLVLVFAIAVENYSLQLDQVLMAGEHVRFVAWAEVIKYVVLIGLACFLAPLHGALGTAWAVAGAMMLAAALKSVAARRSCTRIGALPLLASLGVFSLIFLAIQLPYGKWLVFPVWMVAALALRLLRPAEVRQWCAATWGMRKRG